MHTRILIPTHGSDRGEGIAAPRAPARNRGRGRTPQGNFPGERARRTSFHQSEAQPPNGPLTAATSPDTPSTCPAMQGGLCAPCLLRPYSVPEVGHASGNDNVGFAGKERGRIRLDSTTPRIAGRARSGRWGGGGLSAMRRGHPRAFAPKAGEPRGLSGAAPRLSSPDGWPDWSPEWSWIANRQDAESSRSPMSMR
jgi:hypothetical protein